MLPHIEQPLTRRDALLKGGAGFGGVALSWLLGDNARAADAKPTDPLAAKKPHHPAKAKSVIFLFMEGGPSHIDLFDPKPLLNKLHGQKLPASFKPVILAMGENDAALAGCKRTFKQHGKGGLWFSDWVPHMAGCADDLAVIRSCWADGINHSGGVCQMNTGSVLAGRPSLGSWVSYGLGTENNNLPAFVVMQDNPTSVVNGPRNWGAGFMPAVYQGTRLRSRQGADSEPAHPGRGRRGAAEAEARLPRDAKPQARRRPPGPDRTGRPHPRLRTRLPHAGRSPGSGRSGEGVGRDDSRSTARTRRRRKCSAGSACWPAGWWNAGCGSCSCTTAPGASGTPTRTSTRTTRRCARAWTARSPDYSTDLKRRGLLDSTLVIWGGEFGRTPQSEQGNGRDHNPYGFTMLMAGAGVKGGVAHGTTDDLGLHAVDERLHVHDLHATVLHLMGMDHMKLVYKHKGRPERPTLNEGEPFLKLVGG